MPRLNNKKLAAKKVTAAVRKAAKKAGKPLSTAKLDAAYERARNP